jgi:hypothetical protein
MGVKKPDWQLIAALCHVCHTAPYDLMAGKVPDIVKRALVTKGYGGKRRFMDSGPQPSRRALFQAKLVNLAVCFEGGSVQSNGQL